VVFTSVDQNGMFKGFHPHVARAIAGQKGLNISRAYKTMRQKCMMGTMVDIRVHMAIIPHVGRQSIHREGDDWR
jgi:hypothetical protein